MPCLKKCPNLITRTYMKKKYSTSKNIFSRFYNLFKNSLSQIFVKLVLVCFALMIFLAFAHMSRFSDKTNHLLGKSFTTTFKKSEQHSKSENSKVTHLKKIKCEQLINGYRFVVE